MAQTINPTIKVVIKVYEDAPLEAKYMAYLEDNEYKGIVAQAESVSEVLRELAISIEARNQYRLNTK